MPPRTEAAPQNGRQTCGFPGRTDELASLYLSSGWLGFTQCLRIRTAAKKRERVCRKTVPFPGEYIGRVAGTAILVNPPF